MGHYGIDSVGLKVILGVDAASFLIAATIIALVRVPPASARVAASPRRAPARGQLLEGARYIRSQPLLAWLTAFLALIKWNSGMLLVLITPFVLGFADVRALGMVRSCGGLGMLLGSVFVALGFAPKRRIHAVLGGAAVQGALLAWLGLRASVPTAIVASFLMLFFTPIMATANESIWQNRVPLELQGRVFAFRGFIGGSSLPIALIAAGPLADRVFAPLGGAGPLLASLGGITLIVAAAALVHPSARLEGVRRRSAHPDMGGVRRKRWVG